MILKPFMLRRIKKDVENELSDKIEIMVYCPLTMRQQMLYMALKKKIRIEDLLQYTDRNGDSGGSGHGGGVVDKAFTSNLMNLVMQFRKVCNHPDLFERRDAKSPFSMKCADYLTARLVYEQSVLQTRIPSVDHLLYNRFNIFKAENVHRSVWPRDISDAAVDYSNYIDLNATANGGCFSFTRFCDVSPAEVESIHLNGAFGTHSRLEQTLELLNHVITWRNGTTPLGKCFLLIVTLQLHQLRYSQWKRDLLFTKHVSKRPFYSWTEHVINSMTETMEHRIIRSKTKQIKIERPLIEELQSSDAPIVTEGGNLLNEHHHIARPARRLPCEASSLPTFLFGLGPRVQCNTRKM